MPDTSHPCPRVLEAVCSAEWAITPEMLTTIVSIAERANEAPEAVLSRLPQRLANTRQTQIVDGVAVVPVMGPIFRYANMFTEMSGASSVQSLATEFGEAVRAPGVKAIVLEIDSPGGMVAGISEFAAQVRAANSIKPVVAYVSDLGASAAYWIASAAGEVVLRDTARVGSIGVVLGIVKDGNEAAVRFVSSQSPSKQADPTSDQGRAQWQALVDRLAQVFITTVASYRGVDVGTVMTHFGQGGVLVGSDVVAAGMADRLGSLEAVIADLRRKASTQREATHAIQPAMNAEDRLAHRWKADAALRAEFGDSFASFSHFERAAASGRARIIGRRTH